jgi:hypothetical protein
MRCRPGCQLDGLKPDAWQLTLAPFATYPEAICLISLGFTPLVCGNYHFTNTSASSGDEHYLAFDVEEGLDLHLVDGLCPSEQPALGKVEESAKSVAGQRGDSVAARLR